MMYRSIQCSGLTLRAKFNFSCRMLFGESGSGKSQTINFFVGKENLLKTSSEESTTRLGSAVSLKLQGYGDVASKEKGRL